MSRLFSLVVIASQLLSLVNFSRVSAQSLEPTYEDLVGIQQGTLSFLVYTFAGLQDLDEMANPIPFNYVPLDPADLESPLVGLRPLFPQGLAVVDVAMELYTRLAGTDMTPGVCDDNIDPGNPDLTALQECLDTELDGLYGNTIVDIGAALTADGAGFDVALTISLSQDGATTQFAVDHPDLEVVGGQANIDLALSGTFNLHYTPGGTPAFTLALDGTPPQYQVTFDAAYDSVPFEFNLGILATEIDGTGTTQATLAAAFLDTNSDGVLDSSEWESTAPADLFDVGYSSSGANLDLTVTTDLPGLEVTTGSITLNDTDLSNEIDQPLLTIPGLEDFQNMSPQDFISGIAQSAVLLEAVQVRAGSFELPFLNARMDDMADFNDSILTFFPKHNLSDISDPLALEIDPGELEDIDTVQEIRNSLMEELGLDPDVTEDLNAFGMAYVPGSKELTFNLGLSKDLAAKTVELDFSDQLAASGVVNLTTATSATVDPSFTVAAGIAVDFSPNPPAPAEEIPLLDRFNMKTTGLEFQADALVESEIDMTGRIGFLDIQLVDNNDAGAVTLLDKREADDGAMLRVDFQGGASEKLTYQELFDLLNESLTPVEGQDGAFEADLGDGKKLNVTVNAAVPEFGLKAYAMPQQNTSLLAGGMTVSWPDITVGLPDVSLDPTFEDQLLAFDFEHENPLALLGHFLQTLDTFTSMLDDATGSNDLMSQDLPLVGASYRDLVREVGVITALVDQVNALADDPPYSLMDLETKINEGIAEALGYASNPVPDFLDITLDTSGPGPAAVNFGLNLGVCSPEQVASECLVTRDLSIPFNLSLGKDLPSGIVGVEVEGASGEIAVDYLATASLDFGVQLPEVTVGNLSVDGEGNIAFTPPAASGVPQPYLLDTSQLALQAGLSLETELSASIGPLSVGVGKIEALAESGAECTNNDDDDGDGVVNDGCDPLSNPETGDQCTNDIDDDGDDIANDGCGAVNAPETGDQCTNGVDDDDDGVVNDGCAAIGPGPETGLQCQNNDDDDGDDIANDGCAAVGNPAVVRLGANYTLENNDDDQPDRILLSDTNALDTYLNGLMPDGFQPEVGVTCPGVDGEKHACARLPVFFGSETIPIGVIVFYADDITDPTDDWHFSGIDDILSQIDLEALDWTLYVQGLQFIVDSLESALKAGSYNVNIPVIGDSLDAGANVVTAFNENIMSPISGLAGSIQGTTPEEVQEDLEEFLATLVNEVEAPLSMNIHSVILRCGENSCEGKTLIEITEAEIELTLGATAAEGGFDFDLGFPGLRLATDGQITSSVDWHIDLGFGISKTDGFYLLIDEPLAGIDANVDLPDEISGDLAFIRIGIEDNQEANPDLHLELSLGLTSESGRLTFSNLASNTDPIGFEVNLTGGIDILLGLETTADLGLGDAGALPTIMADLLFQWDFSTGISIGDIETNIGDATLAFNNVQLDIGSFFESFLGPALSEAQRYTKPFQPIIDTINAPIPGITQLAELVGEEPVTMYSLFDAATDADLSMIRRLIDLVTFINEVGDVSSGGIPPIELGSFAVDLEKAYKGGMPAGQKSGLVKDATVETDDLLGDIGGSGRPDLKSKSGSGFSFPAFENPSSIFSLIVGQDVTLIRWDAGKLDAGFGFSKTFGPIAVGPFPVSLVISGSARIEGRFAVGYDTKGIRLAVKALSEGDATYEDITFLFYGVFIDDLDAEGNDVPEIRLTATLAAGAALDLVIVSAGVEGGVKATIDLNLRDGGIDIPPDPADLDGKLRIDEIVSFAANPICMFEVSGKLEAFIRAFVKIDLFLFSKTFSKTIVNIVLLDMKDITRELCEADPPVLAEQFGGVIALNIGPRANQRGFDEGEENEKIIVRQLSEKSAGGTAKVSVSGFGYIEEFDNVSAVYGDGGTQNDVIIMTEGAINREVNGNIVTDVFQFTISAKLCGGPGDDRLAGGEGDDTLYGDNDGGAMPEIDLEDVDLCSQGGVDGHDEISGNGGVDRIHGGGAADNLGGDAGNDFLYGDAGSDRITGGFGKDNIEGGASGDNDACGSANDEDDDPMNDSERLCDHDDIQGGPEPEPTPDPEDASGWANGVTPEDVIDIIGGGPGDDNIEGDVGDDILHGGADNDIILGDKGEDKIYGDGGNDNLFGNEDNDTIYGDTGTDAQPGDGHDDIFGSEGDDILYGNGGNDDIIGGTDSSIACGAGGDELHGGAGVDILLGDEGIIHRDPGELSGMVELESVHAGNDTMDGDGQDDLMYGQAGCDTMAGGTGEDTMYGGADDDVMNGNADDDTMFGDGGVDTMHGDANDDTMRGGNDADEMYGDGEDDVMFGDSGQDTMYGDDNVAETSDGSDIMRGGIDDDVMYGNGGLDYMYGEADDDHMVGGSPDATSADTGDQMWGGTGTDIMAGDNASISPEGVETLLAESTIGGADYMYGDEHMDRMFGEFAGDYMEGRGDDDYMEGNGGADEMYGQEGHDDMIGGGDLAGVPDGGEVMMSGGPGIDVMTGDNASIVRADTGITIGDPARHVELLDVPFCCTVADPDLYGGDTMEGNDGDDYMWGQSGDDIMDGNDGDDYMEGNADQDTMAGGDGRDDMVGGSGYDNPGGMLRELANVLDAGEIEMYGGLGDDIMTGDNAHIKRVDGDSGFERAPDRAIKLYDLQLVAGQEINSGVSGPDTMHGNEGDDVMFGQGNGSQPALQADPPDGVDNDRDGREGAESITFDCLDDFDNDEDGDIDGDDSGCSDLIDEDTPWLGDLMYGEDGDDYMEGNHGADWMFGGAEEDDMIGGGSADDGVIDANRLGDNLSDGPDTMAGQDDDDVILGDNGAILRTLVNGGWQRHEGYGFSLAVRDIQMSQTPEPVGAYGGDYLLGNDGHDDMYGQLGDDYMEGNGGQDAMLGDLGLISNQIEDGSRQQLIQIPAPFVEKTIYETGSLSRQVELYAFDAEEGGQGGRDIILGGDDHDSLHGGPGDDLLNGDGDAQMAGEDPNFLTTDSDAVFGDDGHDALWGGRGNDDLWGGRGNDYLDIKPRDEMTFGKDDQLITLAADPAKWFAYARYDNFQGYDYIYGGWDQDAMQADVGDPGPTEGDRLIDWVGAYNVYYVCPGTSGGPYGEGVITRLLAPDLITFLQILAEADGATGATSKAKNSGTNEVAIVFTRDVKLNAKPVYADHPGHFTCDINTN